MTIKTIFSTKKVKMVDVVSPVPSKAASKALHGALKRAYSDQSAIRHKATAIRSN